MSLVKKPLVSFYTTFAILHFAPNKLIQWNREMSPSFQTRKKRETANQVPCCSQLSSGSQNGHHKTIHTTMDRKQKLFEPRVRISLFAELINGGAGPAYANEVPLCLRSMGGLDPRNPVLPRKTLLSFSPLKRGLLVDKETSRFQQTGTTKSFRGECQKTKKKEKHK